MKHQHFAAFQVYQEVLSAASHSFNPPAGEPARQIRRAYVSEVLGAEYLYSLYHLAD
jgi:hypothetical protein